MSIGFRMIEILFLGVLFSAIFSSVKRKQKYRAFKTSKLNRSPSHRAMRVLPQKDLIRSYSQKNKECYEHEVMVSSLDSEKKKRKKGLWNEPSWDDELYS